MLIRPASVADVEVIAHHRVAMFRDMGSAEGAVLEQVRSGTIAFLQSAIPSGEYVGWLATLPAQPKRVVAGAGVQQRRVLPFPRRFPDGHFEAAEGRQAIAVNVYTEPDCRRQGLARALMQEVVNWARSAGVESLVLHAAPEGRPLYEAIGFTATNEMRFKDDLRNL